MTRREQIAEISKAYGIKTNVEDCMSLQDAVNIAYDFRMGAEWADANPDEKTKEALELVDSSWNGEYGVVFVKSKTGLKNPAEELLSDYNLVKKQLQEMTELYNALAKATGNTEV